MARDYGPVTWHQDTPQRVEPVTQGLVLRSRLWDLLRWMLAVNSTEVIDNPGLKYFNARE